MLLCHENLPHLAGRGPSGGAGSSAYRLRGQDSIVPTPHPDLGSRGGSTACVFLPVRNEALIQVRTRAFGAELVEFLQQELGVALDRIHRVAQVVP